jgi:hypothetical protein
MSRRIAAISYKDFGKQQIMNHQHQQQNKEEEKTFSFKLEGQTVVSPEESLQDIEEGFRYSPIFDQEHIVLTNVVIKEIKKEKESEEEKK